MLVAWGRRSIQRCQACGNWIHYPKPRCPACWSADVRYEPVSGKGTVYTFCVMHVKTA